MQSPDAATVYNFEVADSHTYFVVESGIGAHNTCSGAARGPKGGVKHQLGRGHQRKSEGKHKENFQKKAKAKREAAEAASEQAQQQWDNMSEEARKLRPDLEPQRP